MHVPIIHHQDTSKCNIRILYYNARSLLPKFDNLLLCIYVHRPHIICVVETSLSVEISNTEISIPDSQLFCNDRNRHGGGVLMSMFFVSFILPPPPTLEILILSINFKVLVNVCLFTVLQVHLVLFLIPCFLTWSALMFVLLTILYFLAILMSILTILIILCFLICAQSQICIALTNQL